MLYGGDGDENEDIGMFGEDDFEMHSSCNGEWMMVMSMDRA